MHAYERLGSFYLGREIDAASGADRPDLLLYDSRDLTTHAVCVGMTGSGKTGLCVSLLEEAAIDGIPAIVIDPKGDLGNLLLTFPQLRAEDFAPWIDPGDAARKDMTPEAYAAATAESWRKGLAEWDQDGTRIQRFRDAAETAIYTPGSEAGRPLSVLRSFSAPSAELRAQAGSLRERIAATVAGLLGLVDVDADPIRSREHILLSTLFDEAWSTGRDLDLPALIQAIQKPPFDKVGVLDLETFYPARERLQLAMSLNNLIAAPGFAAWMRGEPLDVQRLLFTAEGRPRIAIVSIAHLNDAQRMFVVTLLLGELVAWMRTQSGTSSLRALLYMDEIFGYFPPTAMPPSKEPLLTLMKQARAFGLGVVLATQNPVDLDYKGLSNAGTWFIGRLQTERDKARVVEGLLGAAGEGLDKSTIDTLLANLDTRVFLMRNVHENAPVLFRTRWALSYLRGPMTLREIAKLTSLQDKEGVAATPRPHPVLPPQAGEGTQSAASAQNAEGTQPAPPAQSADRTQSVGPAQNAEGTPTVPPAQSADRTQPAGPAQSAEGTPAVPPAQNADRTQPVGPAQTTGDAPAAGPSIASPPPRERGRDREGAALPASSAKPVVSADIMEYYLRKPGETSASPTFVPRVLGTARLHFVNKAAGLDVWETRSWIAPLKDAAKPDWDGAQTTDQTAGELGDRLSSRAPEHGNYADAPAALLVPKNYASWRKDLASHIYRCATFTTLRCPQVGANVAPGGSEGDFRARLSLALREKRDAEIDKLRRKYAPRLTTLQDQIRRAEDRVERERSQLFQHRTQTAISIGTSILGALLGRKRISVANVGRVGSAARSAGRIGRESDDVGRAEENREALEQRLKDMQNELEQDISRLAGELDPANVTIERVEVKPRKSDIEVLTIALLWVEE